MRKIVLLITATVALSLTSSGLGARNGFTPNSFNGSYRGQETVTTKIVCPDQPTFSKISKPIALVFRVVNGATGGSPITGVSYLGTGHTHIKVVVAGVTLSGRIGFYHALYTPSVTFQGTINGSITTGTCHTTMLAVLSGHRVSLH